MYLDVFIAFLKSSSESRSQSESTKSSNVFTLETKGMKLTFSIYNLKEVLEVINND